MRFVLSTVLLLTACSTPEAAGSGPAKTTQSPAQVRVVALKHAVAADVATTLEKLLSEGSSDDGQVRVVPNAASNSLLVTGPEPGVERALSLIEKLDLPA